MKDITAFYKEEVVPALFAGGIQKALPEFDFQKRRQGGGWCSHYKLNGEFRKRSDKTVILPLDPFKLREQGDVPKSFIDYLLEYKGYSTPADAIKYLASSVGVSMPELKGTYDAGAAKEKEDALEAVLTSMKNALFSEEGKDTLEYLTGNDRERGQRGYSNDFVNFCEFGYISQGMKAEMEQLRNLCRYVEGKNEKGEPVYNAFSRLIGNDRTKHTLVIPYRTEGKIRGFVFRSILPPKALKELEVTKYTNLFTSKYSTKAYTLFGVTGSRLQGIGYKEKNVTMVEGELDALRALYAGVPNVVGCSGRSVSAEALQKLKERGAEEITILFDTEDSEEAQKKNYEALKKAVRMIEGEGLSSFVCYLPTEDGQKMDVDSFTFGLEGEELQAKGQELTRVIHRANFGFVELFLLTYSEGWNEYLQEDEVDRFFIRLRKKAIDIMNDPLCPPVARRAIAKYYAESGGNDIITEADLLDEADRRKAEVDAAQRESQYKEALSTAHKEAEADPAGAVRRLEENLAKIKQIGASVDLGEYLHIPTEGEISEKWSEKPLGIPTKYHFSLKRAREGESRPYREEFVLPYGAITYICAPTSHGKSRFIENLAVDVAQNGEQGAVLYFTLEEDRESVLLEMLNIFYNRHISADNMRTITSYYSGKTRAEKMKYFKGSYEELERNFSAFNERKATFFKTLIESGKLRVFFEGTRSADKIIRAIKFLRRELHTQYREEKPIKAVFIDYVQLLKKTGSRADKKAQLGAICEDLMNLSVELGVPFILATQLNRAALSPAEMDVHNIADATEIEQSGNIVFLLWNSSEKPRNGSRLLTKEGGLSKEGKDFESTHGFTFGVEGRLFGILAKNRKGVRNVTATFTFDGNTGAITQAEGKVEEQADPFDFS